MAQNCHIFMKLLIFKYNQNFLENFFYPINFMAGTYKECIFPPVGGR